MADKQLTVRDIMETWLRDNGYDGLAYDGCGCGIDELMMCESPCEQCRPAYKGLAPEGEDPGDWFYCDKATAEASMAPKEPTDGLA